MECFLFSIVTANIKQNLFISLFYNSTITLVAAGLFVALGFVLNPALGVALMVLESTLVLGNLIRLKLQKLVTVQANDLVPENKVAKGSSSMLLNSLNHQAQPYAALSNEAPSPTSGAGMRFFTDKKPGYDELDSLHNSNMQPSH